MLTVCGSGSLCVCARVIWQKHSRAMECQTGVRRMHLPVSWLSVIAHVADSFADPDALPVLATRTKIMKVEVKFQTNGMLAPPPKSSLARGQAGPAPASVAGGSGGGAAGPAPAMENVEVLETDNPMSSLLELFAGSAATAAATPAPAPTLAPAPAIGGGIGGTDGGLFGAGPTSMSQTPSQPVDLLGAMSGMSMGPGAPMTSGAPPTVPAAQQHMTSLQPTLNMATQPRTMAEIQGYHAVNPQAGAGPAAQNPFAMQQPFVQQQQAAPMNPFMAPPVQSQGGGPNPFLAVPAPVQQHQHQHQQAAAPKPPNPFDSLI